MIFVSYCHADEKWRERFEMISKPLSRAITLEFWSDKQLEAGEWEPQIEKKMHQAEGVVLLVSPAFLASDYIIKKELPYFIKAHKERGLMIFWAYLEPCDLKWHPQIREFQAMKVQTLKPMAAMTDWQWQETMVHGCGMIDDFLKKLEQPAIDQDVKGKKLKKWTEKFPLLAKPARRETEVLLYSQDKKWWRQSPVKANSRTTTIHLGSDDTKPGTSFKLVALTTYTPLTERNYLNIPDHRTKSEEITLYRA
jgi:hypothetical protein